MFDGNKMNKIKTKRLVIRPIEQGDSEAIHVYAGSPDIDMMMFLPKETMKDTEKFVDFAVSEWEKDEIGWIIRQDKRGQGFATEAARALRAYAFINLKADHVQAHCDSRNAASEGVMKKLGMTLIDGTGTRTYQRTGITSGEYLYSISRQEYICDEFVTRSQDILKDNLTGRL